MQANQEVLRMIDSYLGEVSQQLSLQLPADDVLGQVSEMRAHLLAMAYARMELGANPVDAVQVSIAKFGNPAQLGRKTAPKVSLAFRIGGRDVLPEEKQGAIAFLAYLATMATIGTAFCVIKTPTAYQSEPWSLAAFAALFSVRAWFTKSSPFWYATQLALLAGLPYAILMANALGNSTLRSSSLFLIAYVFYFSFAVSWIAVAVARKFKCLIRTFKQA